MNTNNFEVRDGKIYATIVWSYTFIINLFDFIIQLDSLYGTWRKASSEKKSWNLPQPKMAVTDLSKLLKAEEIRKVLRAPNKKVHRSVLKMNPLKNVKAMLQLNPYEAVAKRSATLLQASRVAKKAGAKPNPALAKRAKAMAKKGGKKK